MLRKCFSTGTVQPLFRVSPPSLIENELADLDEHLRNTFSDIMSCKIDRNLWDKLQLPISSRVPNTPTLGMGILSPKARASSAYLASLIDTEDTCKQIAGKFAWLHNHDLNPHTQSALEDWCRKSDQRVADISELNALLASKKATSNNDLLHKTQDKLSDMVNIHRTKCVTTNGTNKRLAYLRCKCGLPRAKQWLMNSPNKFLDLQHDHVHLSKRIACGSHKRTPE